MTPGSVLVFLDALGLGGTEKAALIWARGLKDRGHEVRVMTLAAGPRAAEADAAGIPWERVPISTKVIGRRLAALAPEAIHCHAPGLPHRIDILGETLLQLPPAARPRVVQTNIFGRLDNPFEDRWVDFRLFVSWTSAVQAGRRAGRPLETDFFFRHSVASNPLEPAPARTQEEREAARASFGIAPEAIVLGRLSRPDPAKWIDWTVRAFRRACALEPRLPLRLLLREPPPAVAAALRAAPDASRFLILPATGDAEELRRTMAACDAILHGSLIGESFGYGIAEPMMLGLPVITHSVPWGDQCQLELVREGETGLVASATNSTARAILRLAHSTALRAELGAAARAHILRVADLEDSLDRVEAALFPAQHPRSPEVIQADLAAARQAAAHLDRYEFGETVSDRLYLLSQMMRVRFGLARRLAAGALRGRDAPV